MRRFTIPLLVLLAACKPTQTEVGPFEIVLDRTTGLIDINHLSHGSVLESLELMYATADTDIEMQFGSFKFTENERIDTRAAGFGKVFGKSDPRYVDVTDSDGALIGTAMFTAVNERTLLLEWTVNDGNRIGWSARCDTDDHFLGLGAHAMDTDHVGHAFDLFVAEPGIGKSEDEDPGNTWQYNGGRHDSSYPVPFAIRPHRSQGFILDTSTRVEVDLCLGDPDRFEILSWEDRSLRTLLFVADDPVGVIRQRNQLTGLGALAPAWVFGPWLDAVRGSANVRDLALKARESHAPVTAIWTEDWKGAVENATGYHLKGEMTLDTDLYPDGVELAGELEDLGIKWLGYFSTFIAEKSTLWDEAVNAGVLIQTQDNEPYTFFGATFETVSMVDLSTANGRDWLASFMDGALELGFDGWMADYAEWLPVDAQLASGEDALFTHNRYPEWWQDLNNAVIAGTDASYFSRSGWLLTSGLAPVVWGGDQQTTFAPDDGLPSVIPMGLGSCTSGTPVFTHDIGGYSTVGVPFTTKELWFRWASLGAFSPVMRTHHGAWDTENWDYDSDDETWAYWTELTREHMRLFPYRYGLAHKAALNGTPMLLPVSFVSDSEDWGRKDAWMLGDALLVAPITDEGSTSHTVELPSDQTWVDWWTFEPAQTGEFTAEIDEINVFARGGTTIPTFDVIPDTLLDVADDTVIDFATADQSRTVYIFGTGGTFDEADGTTYRPSGDTPTAEIVEAVLKDGTVDVGGLQIAVRGPIERTYTFVVVPMTL